MEEEIAIIRDMRNGTLVLSGNLTYSKTTLAAHNVRQRWIMRGIWNPAWEYDKPSGFWRHEEPLELEQEWETDPDESVSEVGPGPKRGRRLKSDTVLEEIRDRLLATIEAREASRPYRQFQMQVQEEKDRLFQTRECHGEKEVQDLDTEAYNNVKSLWVKRRI